MAEEMKAGEKGGGNAAGAKAHDAGAEKDKTKVTSDVAEKAEGQMNPSSPGNTGTTPGTNAKLG